MVASTSFQSWTRIVRGCSSILLKFRLCSSGVAGANKTRTKLPQRTTYNLLALLVSKHNLVAGDAPSWSSATSLSSCSKSIAACGSQNAELNFSDVNHDRRDWATWEQDASLACSYSRHGSTTIPRGALQHREGLGQCAAHTFVKEQR